MKKNTIRIQISQNNYGKLKPQVIINDCTIAIGVGGLVECAASFIT
jgi:hypothetical protein